MVTGGVGRRHINFDVEDQPHGGPASRCHTDENLTAKKPEGTRARKLKTDVSKMHRSSTGDRTCSVPESAHVGGIG